MSWSIVGTGSFGYAELVRVDAGRLVRQFLADEQEPSADVDVGTLPEEAGQPLTTWIDVAGWVDQDLEEVGESAQGLLWIHKVEPGMSASGPEMLG